MILKKNISVNTDNTFDLKKKVIIITGAAGFLGKEYVKEIVKCNGIPICLDINNKKLKELSKEINKKYNIKINYYCIDITKEEKIYLLSKKIIKKFKKVDCLINNAANNPVVNKNNVKKSGLENFSYKNFTSDVNIGLGGAFIMTKYFGKLISKNNLGGSIINISSDLGLISPDQRLYKKSLFEKPVSYSVVKSGILGLTKFTATYWANKNVRCNALCLGAVQKDMSKNFINKVKKLIPLNRMANPKDYLGIILFLCDDRSSYANGATFVIDGGRTIW
jgi:NAD(P)-dependent dehydrogenase (short-subunit alcohol dehydrogenase family)